ncbi:MAG: alpha/beta hydrolase [Deltaproteobacteria bacterium]|nr:alpha/beta hydrolase [Deltaproteobacteria bacterium]
MRPLIVFSHGKDAPPWGKKISFLAPVAREAGWDVHSVDYTDLPDPDERAARLRSLDFGSPSRLVLAGSSMGGYVSVLASERLRPDGLFLMAPAFYLPGYGNGDPRPFARHVHICSGWNDDVVPVESSIRFARATRAELHLFNSDHALWDVLPAIGLLFSAFLRQVLAGQPSF